MMISVQRSCDGPSLNETCDARLELDHRDSRGGSQEHAVQGGKLIKAWEVAAWSIGWRRLRGPGVAATTTIGMTDILLPSTKCWVVCRACASRMNLTGDGFDAPENLP